MPYDPLLRQPRKGSTKALPGGPPTGPAGGDLSGTYPNPTVAAINGSSLGTTTPSAGRLLVGSGTQWVSVAMSGDATLAATGALTTKDLRRAVFHGLVPISARRASVNAPAGGDLSGTYPSPTVARINGNSLGSTTPSAGRLLVGSGTQWVSVSMSGDASLASTGSLTLATSGVAAGTYGSATQSAQVTVDAKGRVTAATNVAISGVPPGGAAGGDLTGTYPNPTLKAMRRVMLRGLPAIPVSHAGIRSGGSPTGSAGGDLTGTYPNPTVAKINGAALGTTTPTSGNLLIGSGTQWVTNAMSGDATLASTGSLTLANSGVAAGTYGSATQSAQVTVDAKGRVTAATNVAISGVPPGGVAGGDLTGTYPNPQTRDLRRAVFHGLVPVSALRGSVRAPASGDLTGFFPSPVLVTTGVTPNSYGSATQVPQLTVDAKGRLTAVTNVTISGTAPGGTAGGDLTGTYPNPQTRDLRRAVFHGALAMPASRATVRGSGSGSPTGPAGGDLTGTYPNPTVAAINGNPLGTTTPSAGQLLVGSGTAWVSVAISGDASLSSTGSLTLANSGVAAGTYGSATQTPQVTVDAKGRVTSATNVAISGVPPGGAAGGDLSGTYPNPQTRDLRRAVFHGLVPISARRGSVNAPAGGDLTGTYPNPTLVATGVTAASYGDATHVGAFTVDAKGRLTAASSVAISGTPPGGPAGGDLTGTYPNPTLKTARRIPFRSAVAVPASRAKIGAAPTSFRSAMLLGGL